MTSQLFKHFVKVQLSDHFKSDKMNTKVDVLTLMSLVNVSESAQQLEDCFQTILILDRVNVLLIELKANLYQ